MISVTRRSDRSRCIVPVVGSSAERIVYQACFSLRAPAST